MASERVGLRPLALSIAAAGAVEMAVAWGAASGRLAPLWVIGMGRTAEIVGFLIIFHGWGGGLGRIGLSRGSILPGLARGAIWAIAVGAAAGAGLLTLYVLGANPMATLGPSLPRALPDPILLFLVGGLIGPVAEEIFFRGILYGFFRRWGVAPAMLLSTAAFVLLHANGGFIQLAGGLLFAAAYEAERRLAAPILIHVAGNMALFVLPLLPSLP